MSELNGNFSSDEVGRVQRMKITRMELDSNGEDILRDSINALKKSVTMKSMQSNKSKEDLTEFLNKLRNDKSRKEN